MTRKSILGLALVAVLAISAVMAASASAFFDATHETESTSGTQTTNHVFKTAVGTVTCKSAKFTGTQTGKETAKGSGVFTSETVTQHPTYSECTAFGFPATVTTTGCNYVFSRTGSTSEDVKTGKVTIECESGKTITINALGFCNMTVGAQGPLGTVTYTNNTTEGDVTVSSNVTGITYSGSCGSGSEGVYTGSATVKGANGAVKVT